MNSVFLLKKDFAHWIKKNKGKLLTFALICLFSVVIGIRNGLLCDLQTTFFASSTTIFGFLRGEVTLLNVLIWSIVEWTLMLTIIVCCSYNGIAVYFSLLVTVYKSYSVSFAIVVVLRSCMFGGLFFALSYALVGFASLLILAYSIIYIFECRYAYRFGMKEFKRTFFGVFSNYYCVAFVILLELIFLCFSKIFI